MGKKRIRIEYHHSHIITAVNLDNVWCVVPEVCLQRKATLYSGLLIFIPYMIQIINNVYKV